MAKEKKIVVEEPEVVEAPEKKFVKQLDPFDYTKIIYVEVEE